MKNSGRIEEEQATMPQGIIPTDCGLGNQIVRAQKPYKEITEAGWKERGRSLGGKESQDII